MRTKLLTTSLLATMIMGGIAHGEPFKVTTAAPAKTPWVTHLEKSAENLAANSGGKLTMEVFAASQLGAEVETIKQTARGRLEIGAFSITAASVVVPEVSLLVTPFFWDSFEQAECAVDNHLTEVFNELFEARGLRIVQWQELGWQNLFVNEPIKDPSGIKGVKMRVAPAKNHESYWRTTGASGVPLPFNEIATALETGIVEGGELPTISYVAAGIGKLSPHLINTRHIYQPSIMLISKKVWDGMSAEEQEIFDKSIEDAQELRKAVRDAIAFFENKHVEEGGTIDRLDDDARAKWSALYTEDEQKALIASVGGESERVWAEVLKAREACTK